MNENKRCNNCREIKLVKDFRIIKDKYNIICIDCEKKRSQKSRDKNFGINESNPTRQCNICKNTKPLSQMFRSASGWYRKCCNNCYETNISEEIKNRDLKTKETRRINERNRHRKNPIHFIWKAAKARAKKNNLQFNIDESDIIIPEYCPVLGIKIEKSIGNSTDNSPTLDKIIPELGYIKNNICVISWRANILKRDGKLYEFEKIILYLREKLEKK